MPEDPTKQHQPDVNRVNIHDHGAVDFWCRRLKCTRAQLVVAVHTVGSIPTDVSNYLREVVPPTKLQAMAVRNPQAPASSNRPPSINV